MKIAYNNCYGGFSISAEAVKLARELSGNPKWQGCILKGELYDNGQVCTCEHNSADRTDPILIKVIEQLGSAANGSCAKLRIAEVPHGTRYRIDEYDGNESVMTIDDYGWDVADDSKQQ